MIKRLIILIIIIIINNYINNNQLLKANLVDYFVFKLMTRLQAQATNDTTANTIFIAEFRISMNQVKFITNEESIKILNFIEE